MKRKLQNGLMMIGMSISSLYSQNLLLDTTFGPSGNTINGMDKGISVNVLPTYSQIRDVELQSDGKIVTFGSIKNSNGQERFGVSRYNIDGSLDLTFGSNGVDTFLINSNYPQYSCRNYEGAVQSSGKIISAGRSPLSTSAGTFNEGTILRINANGGIDSTFGINGRNYIDDRSPNYSSAIQTATVMPDDKIITTFSGWDGVTNLNYRPGIAKWTAAGDIDSTFGINGFCYSNIYGETYGSKIQSDGKIILVGYIMDSNNYDKSEALIERFLPNGIVDSSFGNNGHTRISVSTYSPDERFLRCFIQPDGKIIATGWTIDSLSGSKYRVLTARFNTNGSIDSSFGNNGTIDQSTTAPHDQLQQANSKTFGGGFLLPDGSFIISSENKYSVGRYTSIGSLGFHKYNSSGSLDSTFGVNGFSLFTLSSDTTTHRFDDLTILPSGEIIIGGFSYNYASGGSYVSNTLAKFSISNNTTSLKKNIIPGNYTIFPNPSNGNINIQSKGQGISKTSIYNSTGKLIYFKDQLNLNNINIDISEFKNGFYFLNIINKKGISTTIKLVKN
jgi:uncharacterized delta-60 repeat protein